MDKKNNIEKQPEEIREMSVSSTLTENFMPYAMSVIVSRALPEIDGFKPSHRKLLYTMYEMGLLDGNRTKSANIAARTMLLNPHGDASNYETMVRLTQNNETLLTPYVDGKGNFGKHYSRDMSFAASRYTEAKLAPIASEIFGGIRKNTVDFMDNYDGTRKEPVLLPVSFPTILANPTEGIAVGMASSIPSFNLGELCDATIMRIEDPSGNVRSVMPSPDFTTGGFILNDETAMASAYETGRGSIKLRARYQVDTKKRIIEITQIPFTTTAEAVIEGVISLIKAGKVTEVSDVRNEIDLKGFRIAIDYKRGVDPEALVRKLFKLTKLQDVYSFNMTVLIGGFPQVLGVSQILDKWLEWRRGCIVRELTFDLDKKQKDLHRLEGLAKVLLDIDKAIRIIRESEDDDDVIPSLMEGFDIDEEQAVYIAEIKLRNLNKNYIIDRTNAISRLREEIEKLKKQIGSPREINKIIVKTLRDIKKKYAITRRCELIEDDTETVSAAGEQVSDHSVSIFCSRENYIKKIPETALKNDPEIKVKDGDEIVLRLDTKNDKQLLFFTDRHNVYKVDINDIKDSKPSELGDVIGNLADFEPGERVVFTCASDSGKFLVIGFDNGKTAKVPLSAYETKQKRKKLLNGYYDGAGLLGMYAAGEDEMFYHVSSRKKMLIFSSSDIPLKTTKTTQGVQTIRLPKDASSVKFGRLADIRVRNQEKYMANRIPSSGGQMSMTHD